MGKLWVELGGRWSCGSGVLGRGSSRRRSVLCLFWLACVREEGSKAREWVSVGEQGRTAPFIARPVTSHPAQAMGAMRWPTFGAGRPWPAGSNWSLEQTWPTDGASLRNPTTPNLVQISEHGNKQNCRAIWVLQVWFYTLGLILPRIQTIVLWTWVLQY
jgi:hypothetical protein